MFLGITACLFVFVITGAGTTDITLSEVSFVICRDPSYLFFFYDLHHTCFVYCLAVTSSNFIHGLSTYIPFLQDELVDALPNIMTLA